MNKDDIQRVVFYSINDMAGGHHLLKGEKILRNSSVIESNDINDILELHNIKQYIDNGLYLVGWSKDDIEEFKKSAQQYGNVVGQFMSRLDDNNFTYYYDEVIREYKKSFWTLVNNQKIYKHISSVKFETVLLGNPYEISTILANKNIVKRYSSSLRSFLITYPHSAEILLSIYEVKDTFYKKNDLSLPDCLTIEDKEGIIIDYINSDDCNINYLRLIKNAKNRDLFKLSDKTRLKAAKKETQITNERFSKETNISLQKYGVSVTFNEDQSNIKEVNREEMQLNYSYSSKYVTEYNEPYILFQNFNFLFEYLDEQNRIELVSKKGELAVIERLVLHSESEYRTGFTFRMKEMRSLAQLVGYSKILNDQNKSLEQILETIYLLIFQKEYDFPSNARISMPCNTLTSIEKLILLAPEFESVLKQYKLFVEDGALDLELLQFSSTPLTIGGIPSLNKFKYLYLNRDNMTLVGCSNLFFSDQTTLGYVDPYKDKSYVNFFDLLANEDVLFENYEEYQKIDIKPLIDHDFLFIDTKGFIQITNIPRVLILKDIYENEVGSFYHYPKLFRNEAQQMINHNFLFSESTLLSRPEQSYFNYFLNKSEFTNGLDLRNSYVHGTQANREEVEKHNYAYNTYLKLLVLVLLKIEDDLFINHFIQKDI